MRTDAAPNTALALLLIGLAAPATPQTPAAAPDVMSVSGLTCIFSVTAIGLWKDGRPEPQVRSGGTLSLRFVDIDTQDGAARQVGANGSGEVILQASLYNLHFLDTTRAGRMAITTVFAQETRPGFLKAVHTRTDYLRVALPGFESEPSVSQHYGECEAVRQP
jgi:hypothetical protein